MLLLLLSLIAFDPAACAAYKASSQFADLELLLDSGRGTDEGCVNIGGTCTGELPCCGEAACYQYRCVAMPPQAAAKATPRY
jgi:hypothetical protein